MILPTLNSDVPNLYGMVGNKPLRLFDVLGLTPELPNLDPYEKGKCPSLDCSDNARAEYQDLLTQINKLIQEATWRPEGFNPDLFGSQTQGALNHNQYQALLDQLNKGSPLFGVGSREERR